MIREFFAEISGRTRELELLKTLSLVSRAERRLHFKQPKILEEVSILLLTKIVLTIPKTINITKSVPEFRFL